MAFFLSTVSTAVTMADEEEDAEEDFMCAPGKIPYREKPSRLYLMSCPCSKGSSFFLLLKERFNPYHTNIKWHPLCHLPTSKFIFWVHIPLTCPCVSLYLSPSDLILFLLYFHY